MVRAFFSSFRSKAFNLQACQKGLVYNRIQLNIAAESFFMFPKCVCLIYLFTLFSSVSAVYGTVRSPVMTSLYSSQIRGGANGGRDPRAEAGGQLRPRRRVWRGKREETTGGGRG